MKATKESLNYKIEFWWHEQITRRLDTNRFQYLGSILLAYKMFNTSMYAISFGMQYILAMELYGDRIETFKHENINISYEGRLRREIERIPCMK